MTSFIQSYDSEVYSSIISDCHSNFILTFPLFFQGLYGKLLDKKLKKTII